MIMMIKLAIILTDEMRIYIIKSKHYQLRMK
jgi:hypothetical protein